MLPESGWNTPYITIEDSRKVSQLQKFVPLSELWDSPFPKTDDKHQLNWEEIFEFQHRTLMKSVSEASSSVSHYNQLQNSSWQYGKSLAEKDWPTANIFHPHDAFLALSTLRVGTLKNSESFILERKTANACTFYWMSSPIEHTELCMLYHEIFRGYFYHLSRNLRMEVHSSILPSSDEKVKAWKINLLWID